ncbi:uncharacterized protein LOC132715468 [Ruditapes philippinarum]|uniref:uncharacterized protein LOC132715468 n=1 Tax=Ruditapes philippinarum TaxID=129788 RepID=UPI00295B7FE9|nr:uncharacterized protein LOC132715468 [Ruditapes philippinarum]
MDNQADMEIDRDDYSKRKAKNNVKSKRPAKFSPLMERKAAKTYIRPKDACIFDGRLLKLADEDIEELERNNTIEVGEGSFGKVFKSSKLSEGFGIDVVVKKIPWKKGFNHTSIRREMITSKVVHPFILPLLSVVDKPVGKKDRKSKEEVWFVSPYFSNGDLRTAIQTKGKDLNAMTRVRILLQIALALKYIHTGVPDVRDVILHKDISSQNIVLDNEYNARLIDFGLAREKSDVSGTRSERLAYSHPNVGKGEKSTEFVDYYSFAVIIREMLTSLGPSGINNLYLKHMSEEQVSKNVDQRIWGNDSLIDHGPLINKLNAIACKCLDVEKANKWNVREFDKQVVGPLKTFWKDFNGANILQVPENYPNCHLCLINPAARESSMTQSHLPNCTMKIQACIACEKNSFLNPIACYCGKELTPVIGHRWGALLVAGIDRKTNVAPLENDIKEIEKLISSKAPRIIGISEDNISTVTPNKQEDNEKLWPKVKEHIVSFSERSDIDTLLIYFSCHGEKENHRFVLGSDSDSDSFTVDEFKIELERLKNIKMLYIFLDRCFPPTLAFTNDQRKYIQINACGSNEEADFTKNGSVFTKHFIDGLKARSEGMKCNIHCTACMDFWRQNTDFITVSSLFEYIKKHMKRTKGTPTISLNDHTNIAFHTDEEVKIDFTECETKTEHVIPLSYIKDIEELEQMLLQEFNRDETTKTKVFIKRRTYRKENELEDCETLEKVMRAWVLRQPLEVVFKSATDIEEMEMN